MKSVDPNQESVREILRLTQDNNKMLHKMRRNAFLGGLFKFILYAALLLAPIWLYMQYLAPIVQSMQQTITQIQGTGAQAQAQFNGFANAWKEFQSKLPSFMQPKQ